MDNTATLALLKALSDETRLSIVSILAQEDCYVELIAARLGLTPATVCYHLKKMEAVGLVRCSRSQFYIIYSLDRGVFDRTLSELILSANGEPADPSEEAAREAADAAYRAEVIAHFFKYGKLIRIPAQQKKQAIIYAEIASRFARDTDYTEREVNARLAELYDDICTLRRGLISAGLMTRTYTPGEPDVYRRV